MKKIFILVMASTFAHSTFSQAFQIRDLNTLHDHYTLEKSRGSSIDPDRYARVDGSPFLEADFKEGEVVINDSARFEKVPMRYNIFIDKIEYQDATERILQVNTTGNNFEFFFNDRRFNTNEYIERGNHLQGILELLVDGHIQLYRKYNIDFKEATKAMGYQDPKPNRFIRQDDTFLIAIGSSKPEAVFSRRDLLARLVQIVPDLRDYLKSNRVRMGAESSVVDLIEYCNGVLAKD